MQIKFTVTGYIDVPNNTALGDESGSINLNNDLFYLAIGFYNESKTYLSDTELRSVGIEIISFNDLELEIDS